MNRNGSLWDDSRRKTEERVDVDVRATVNTIHESFYALNTLEWLDPEEKIFVDEKLDVRANDYFKCALFVKICTCKEEHYRKNNQSIPFCQSFSRGLSESTSTGVTSQ